MVRLARSSQNFVQVGFQALATLLQSVRVVKMANSVTFQDVAKYVNVCFPTTLTYFSVKCVKGLALQLASTIVTGKTFDMIQSTHCRTASPFDQFQTLGDES